MLKEVKIELTNRCARNCKHCSSSATNSDKHIKELDYEDVKKVIYDAKRMNVETIVFTGGEPLMYERLLELVKLTSELGMKSTIYTFAYRNDETLKKYTELLANGLNKIIYSLADALSDEKDISIYSHIDFFEKVFQNTYNNKNSKKQLGFHYTVSRDSISKMKTVVLNTLNEFNDKYYFDKVSLLRFVPHGKGIEEMDLTSQDLLSIKDLYMSVENKSKIRLGSPWNILCIENNPCIIADEIMIIGFDGIAYPCDSIKYFTELGVSGNIKEDTIEDMYNSEYFFTIRRLNTENLCAYCKDYNICKSGCIGQKIIANYDRNYAKTREISNNEVNISNAEILKKCINTRDPKCLKQNEKVLEVRI